MNITRRGFTTATALAALSVAGPVRAQTPAAVETLKIINGFAPGGTADAISRKVAERLQSGYARASVVENRTGAGGQIAVQAVKAAAPDGLTLLLTPMSQLGVYPHIYKKLPYDPVADLQPVSMGCLFDFALGVGPSVPASVNTVQSFLAWCTTNPSQASFGSPAAGSVPHFIGELLARRGKVKLNHVAYRGTQPAILDMIGGHVPAVVGPVGEFSQHVQAGKCRLLGVSGVKRNAFASAIPTFVEQGLEDFSFSEWFGFFVPTKTPNETVQRLNTALVQALSSPDTVSALASLGMEAAPTTPAELRNQLQTDLTRWGPLVKQIGFTADS